MQIGLLLFPNLTQLDLTGPFEVFARMPGTDVHLLWKDLEPVRCDRGMRILPTTTLGDCPQLDVICVPGGPGQIDLMADDDVLDFLRGQAAGATWITSVCTGSLVLGAAGLLRGYRAACHWASLDQLALLGAVPDPARWVIDRNRATGGGVTSGIDFALALAARIAGAPVAKAIQLSIEYAPAPPFACGHPDTADAGVTAAMQPMMAPMLARRRAATEAAARRLRA